MVELVFFDPPSGRFHQQRWIFVFVGKERIKRQSHIWALAFDLLIADAKYGFFEILAHFYYCIAGRSASTPFAPEIFAASDLCSGAKNMAPPRLLKSIPGCMGDRTMGLKKNDEIFHLLLAFMNVILTVSVLYNASKVSFFLIGRHDQYVAMRFEMVTEELAWTNGGWTLSTTKYASSELHVVYSYRNGVQNVSVKRPLGAFNSIVLTLLGIPKNIHGRIYASYLFPSWSISELELQLAGLKILLQVALIVPLRSWISRKKKRSD